MAVNDPGDWRELFDAALFEPSRVKLRERIENARHTINNRRSVLMKDSSENRRTTPEHIALRDALSTLAELHRIVYARKPSTKISARN